MAAYAALAFLSLLWGSSFLLIKIAARAFDPFGFALARVGVAAAAMLLASALSGKVWPGSRPGLWLNLLALALIGQVVPFILLGKAATLTTSADMALMMGAQPIFVFLFGRFLGSRDRWTWLGALGLLRWICRRRRHVLVAGSASGRPFRIGAGVRPRRRRLLRNGRDHLRRRNEGDRRREGGDRVDDDIDARPGADRLGVRESAAARDARPDPPGVDRSRWPRSASSTPRSPIMSISGSSTRRDRPSRASTTMSCRSSASSAERSRSPNRSRPRPGLDLRWCCAASP